jgi:hypothetical protein
MTKRDALTHRIIRDGTYWGTYCGNWCQLDDLVISKDPVDCFDCLHYVFNGSDELWRGRHGKYNRNMLLTSGRYKYK